MKERNKIKFIASALYGICIAFAVVYYFSADLALNARTIMIPALTIAGCYIANSFFKDRVTIKKWIPVYAILFSIAMVVGSAVADDHSIKNMFVPFTNVFISLAQIIGFSASTYMLLVILLEKCDKIEAKSGKLDLKYKLLIGAGLFLVFLMAYLAFYPGAFSYDMRKQTWEAMTHNVERHHPPLHTYYWGLCLWIYKHTGFEAIILYSISQMIMMAWACTEVTVFLFERYRSKALLIGTLLFFSNPAVALMSFICTKDVVFTVFLMLALVSVMRQDKYDSIRGIVYGALACLLRNNAVYAVVLALLVVLVIPAKKYSKKRSAIKYFLIITIIYFVIDKGIYTLAGVGPGWSKEKLSVPMQQMTSVMVYEEDSVSEEYKAAIKFFFGDDGYKDYNPRFADPVKNHISSERYDENKKLFWTTWFHVGVTHPDNYINAFLTLNMSFWYPDATPRDMVSDRHYIQTMIRDSEYYTFERHSLLPKYYDFLMKFANYDDIAEVPVLSLLYSIALPVWILLAMMAFALERKQTHLMVIGLPILMMWVTLIAGPVALFRYTFPIYMLYPLLIGMMVYDKKKE